jgi:hypothetical protein
MGPKVHYTGDGVTAVCGAADTQPYRRKLSPDVEYISLNPDNVNCGACHKIKPILPPTPNTFGA